MPTPRPTPEIKRLRGLRYGFSLLAGICFIWGIGIKDHGSSTGLLLMFVSLFIGYSLLRKERRLVKAAQDQCIVQPPPAAGPP